jgi:hypothetical protein
MGASVAGFGKAVNAPGLPGGASACCQGGRSGVLSAAPAHTQASRRVIGWRARGALGARARRRPWRRGARLCRPPSRGRSEAEGPGGAGGLTGQGHRCSQAGTERGQALISSGLSVAPRRLRVWQAPCLEPAHARCAQGAPMGCAIERGRGQRRLLSAGDWAPW